MRKSVLLGSVIWCAVVAVVAVAVWQAIAAAGEDAFGDSAGASPSLATPSTSRAPRPTATPTPSSAPGQAQTRSWSGAAGTVVVRCAGSVASLESVTPADGYRFEIDKGGPEEVRVELGRGDQEVRVEARCDGGAARFSVEDRGDGSEGSPDDDSGPG